MPSNFDSLTSKQKKVYLVIESYIKTRGIPPTVREIGELVGEKTPGAVQGILNRLEQKGVIKREVGAARSIQLVSDNQLYENPQYVPEIKKITSRNVKDLMNIYNIKKYHPVSPELLGDCSKLFMIECPDNSLLDSGITYGDLLVIKTDAEYNDGDIVLLLYDNMVLLRRFYKTDSEDKIRLEADSDLTGKNIFDSSEIVIVGKLVAKMTFYNK